MPFFSPSSSESSHPPKNGESLSEAFLDTSSVRDTLPEQYRTHFDELRGSILAFCHEFDIPVSALSNKEVFGVELNSKKIPQERMKEAVSLFERLEHLVTNREPLKKELPEYLQEVESLYHLTEQYASQFNLLKEAGILNERNAIVGIDGEEYSVPTLEQIAQRLYERREELSVKRDQGFTKLLLVPFGMSLDTLCRTLKQFLLSYKTNHPDFDLDIDDPLYTLVEGYEGGDLGNAPKLFYDPQLFDRENINNHGGKTKTKILEEQDDRDQVQGDGGVGWHILLLQPSNLEGVTPIPREGKGTKRGYTIPRPDIEAGQSSKIYLEILQEAKGDPISPYYGESGMTPEDWILAFMTHLTETGKPLDDDGTDTESMSFLIGGFIPSFSSVPRVFWNDLSHQVNLGRGVFPAKNIVTGTRFVVRV